MYVYFVTIIFVVKIKFSYVNKHICVLLCKHCNKYVIQINLVSWFLLTESWS